MKLIHKASVAIVFAFGAWSVHAGLNMADPVPIGPQVHTDQLANGLTYYIQKNSRPEKRLELRLVVKAGSILEEEDQLGLAHFTEHMAFNGSTHFKKHELISYLQSIGLSFGADLNAYTGFNETVYILPLPTDKREAVEKGFLVLQDWAQGLDFNDVDVDLERAIVLEELRLRQGFQDRVNRIVLPKILKGTPYAERMPIGTEKVIKGFKYEAIKRFYKDWYRPDLMAVVVVGDIEPADAKALIESHFNVLKNPENPRLRTYPKVAVRTQSEAVVIADKEAPNNTLQMLYPVTTDKVVHTFGDERDKMVEQLFGMLLGLRMQALTQQASPPFVSGGSALSGLVPGFKSFGASAVLGRQGVAVAVDALVLENERARRFGFSVDELERGKKNMLRELEQAHAEREKTNSASYAAEYIRHFLVKETIPGIANELAYAIELLPTIGVADVNAFAARMIPDKAAKLVVYAGTDKADSHPPTEPQLLDTVQQAEQRPVQAVQEKAVATTLMDALPKPGTIVKERRNEALGLTELELSNGIRVIVKPTDFKNDEIRMAADRFGGQSLFSQKDMYNAAYASSAAAAMGLGHFAPLEMQKMLAGKVVGLSGGLESVTETLNGSSSKADLETLLQLVHLRFASPRRDEDLYQSFITRSQDGAKNALARPEAVFRDALQTTLYADHPRVSLTPRPEIFGALDQERMRSIYEERFSSAKGFTFIFVGSLQLDTLKPLLLTYLASLPTADLPVGYVDLGVRPVQGVVKKEVRAGKESKSQVAMVFAGPAPYSHEENMRVRALVEVMNIKIIDVLREKLTLIYGGGMGGGLQRDPYPSYRLGMSLPCGPDNVEQVIAAAWGEIRKLQDDGPQAGDLDKVKKNWLIDHRRLLRENSYWLGQLQAAYLYGADPEAVLGYEQRVQDLSTADVQSAAKRYLRQDNYVQMVLNPEK